MTQEQPKSTKPMDKSKFSQPAHRAAFAQKLHKYRLEQHSSYAVAVSTVAFLKITIAQARQPKTVDELLSFVKAEGNQLAAQAEMMIVSNMVLRGGGALSASSSCPFQF